ncbi:MAG: DUF1045 domain-containing protein [Candidatus Shapirobacteria bacterium]|jgi:hypothetical protein
MDDTIVVNVVFNIENPLHDDIVEISLEIRDKYGSDWFVDDQRYFLHHPLYLFAAPKKNERKIIEISKKFLKSLSKVDVTIENLFFNQSGLVMIKFNDNKQIYDYHCQSLDLFNPLREGLVREKYRNQSFVQTLEKDEQKKLKEYGHIYVLDRYEPHVTIARIRDLDVCQQIVNEYRERLVGKQSSINKLQVHEAVFGPEGKSVLIVDEAIK